MSHLMTQKLLLTLGRLLDIIEQGLPVNNHHTDSCLLLAIKNTWLSNLKYFEWLYNNELVFSFPFAKI